jgi:Zn-dependent protease with chaperone function
MDFFEHQDVARRKTGLLVVYFLLAVVAIIVGIYLAAVILFTTAGSQIEGARGAPAPALWDPGVFSLVAVGVIVVVALGSLYKIAQLSSGGDVVAQMLGGRLISQNTRDLDERMILNVVEEMAIASGTPVPPVYLLEAEEGINAFAAGFSPDDAVIGVTRGCAQTLSRDQLQGVIAHEFSHILNGDMRLNIRLIGIVHGILLIALIGYFLLRSTGGSRRTSRGKGKGAGAIVLFGLALFVIGYAGVFFGRLIKSAVSRQREFLADASAVQFTRNPAGIAGALKKIGGLARGAKLDSPRAEEASHMFFGNGVVSFLNIMSTHPPLDERIRRIDPSFDGQYPQAVRLRRTESDLVRADVQRQSAAIRDRKAGRSGEERRRQPFDFLPGQAVAGVGAPGIEHVAYAAALLAAIPEAMAQSARESFGARAVIYGLLLDDDPAVRDRQLKRLQQHVDPAVFHETEKLMGNVNDLTPEMRIPLVEMALPALRQLSPAQYQSFRDSVNYLVKADEEINQFEYILHRMLLNHLAPHFGDRKPPLVRYRSLEPLVADCSVLLSMLAYVGNDDDALAAHEFAAGAKALGLPQAAAPELLSRQRADLKSLDDALNRLAEAAPQVKKRVLEACATTIGADGRTTVEESEILRVIADSLDCPMPPLLA